MNNQICSYDRKGEHCMSRNKGVFFVVIASLLVLSISNLNCGKGGPSSGGKKPENQTAEIVESRYSELKPALDGMDTDELWTTMEPTTIAIEDGQTFDVKTSYDDENIYFLVKWIDADGEPMSSTGSWIQKDGKWTWEFLSDGVSFIWDRSGITDFATTGCTTLCHDQADDLDRRYMGPENSSDYAELWVWNPGVIDTKGIMASYIIEALPEGVTVDDAYFNNKVTWKQLPGEYGFVHNISETEYAPKDQITGDKAPLYIITDAPASGDAGIIKAKGLNEGAFYTLEIARPRFPSNKDDLQSFEVEENGWKDILFGCAFHQNDDRDSHITMQVAATLRLVGKNAVAE